MCPLNTMSMPLKPTVAVWSSTDQWHPRSFCVGLPGNGFLNGSGSAGVLLPLSTSFFSFLECRCKTWSCSSHFATRAAQWGSWSRKKEGTCLFNDFRAAADLQTSSSVRKQTPCSAGPPSGFWLLSYPQGVCFRQCGIWEGKEVVEGGQECAPAAVTVMRSGDHHFLSTNYSSSMMPSPGHRVPCSWKESWALSSLTLSPEDARLGRRVGLDNLHGSLEPSILYIKKNHVSHFPNVSRHCCD